MKISTKLRKGELGKGSCLPEYAMFSLFGEGLKCSDADDCRECWLKVANRIADAIDEERRELKAALKEHSLMECSTAQLPEGVQWPRFEDGELVMFGDVTGEERLRGLPVDAVYVEENGAFRIESGKRFVYFRAGESVKRPKQKIVGKDGKPIEVGDTVYGGDGRAWLVTELNPDCKHAEHGFTVRGECGSETREMKPEWLTHDKTDSLERVMADAEKDCCGYFGGSTPTCQGCACPASPGADGDVDCDKCNVEQRRDLLKRQAAILGRR